MNSLLLILGIVAVYLLPALISFLRRDSRSLLIFLLNLFAGWSVIGWFGSFFYAILPVGKRAGAIQLTITAMLFGVIFLIAAVVAVQTHPV